MKISKYNEKLIIDNELTVMKIMMALIKSNTNVLIAVIVINFDLTQ